WKSAATCFATGLAVAAEASETADRFRGRGAAARAADPYSGGASFRRGRAGSAACGVDRGCWVWDDLLFGSSATARPHAAMASAAVEVAPAHRGIGRRTASAAEALPDRPQFEFLPSPTCLGPLSVSANL